MSESGLFGKNFLAEILGAPLKNYVTTYGENPSIVNFLCKNTLDCANENYPAAVSASLTNFLISVAAAFNYIENPNAIRRVGEEITTAFDGLIAEMHEDSISTDFRASNVYNDKALIPYLDTFNLNQLYVEDIPQDQLIVVAIFYLCAIYPQKYIMDKIDYFASLINNISEPIGNAKTYYSKQSDTIKKYLDIFVKNKYLSKFIYSVYDIYNGLSLNDADNNEINKVIDYVNNNKNVYTVATLAPNIDAFPSVSKGSTEIKFFMSQTLHYCYEYATTNYNGPDPDEELFKTYKQALKTLKTVYPRFTYIEKLLNSKADYNIYLQTIKEIVLATPLKPKNVLTNPYIHNFFTNYVLKDTDFYSQFFNVVDVETNKVLDIYNPGIVDYTKIRLNVKYLKNFVTGGQKGGKTEIPIVFDKYVPSATNVTGIYIGNVLIDSGYDANSLKNMVDTVYETAGAKDTTITILGKSVIIKDIIDKFIKNYNTTKKEDIFKNKLKNILKTNKTEASCSTFVDDESRMREQMLREKTKWVRDDNNAFYFVKYEQGKPIEDQLTSMCVFINEAENNCNEFFTTCALSNDADFPKACDKFIDNLSFINIPQDQMAATIVKMNPIFAFSVLKRFNFGFNREIGKEPFDGFERYRVESVGSWIKDMQNDDINKVFGKNAKEIIARICKNNNLLNYLSILVDWVNANPQVLNPEEGTVPKFSISYPSTDKSFNLYGYVDPYKSINRRLLDLTSCFTRLKSSIGNRILGYDGSAMLNNINMNRSDIRMPYNREAFLYAVPYETLGITLKNNLSGGFSDPYRPLNPSSSYEFFFDIYRMLIETMEQIQNSKIRLSANSRSKIDEKLNGLKKLEDQIYRELKVLTEENALYKASYGYINAYDIPPENLPAIIQKHSNILGLTSRYNRKAINLIDVLNTISNALLTKYGNSAISTGTTYKRPLSASYPEYSATSF